MYVNGVNTAKVNETEYTDGWMRAFKSKQIPVFSDYERKFLTDYINSGKLEEVIIYLEHYRYVDIEMAGFCLRELLRGNM